VTVANQNDKPSSSHESLDFVREIERQNLFISSLLDRKSIHGFQQNLLTKMPNVICGRRHSMALRPRNDAQPVHLTHRCQRQRNSAELVNSVHVPASAQSQGMAAAPIESSGTVYPYYLNSMGRLHRSHRKRSTPEELAVFDFEQPEEKENDSGPTKRRRISLSTLQLSTPSTLSTSKTSDEDQLLDQHEEQTTPLSHSPSETAEEPLLGQGEEQKAPSGPTDSHNALSELDQKQRGRSTALDNLALVATLRQEFGKAKAQLQLVMTRCQNKDKVIEDLEENIQTSAQLQFETWKQKQQEDAIRQWVSSVDKLEQKYAAQDQRRMDEITEWKDKFEQKEREVEELQQHNVQEVLSLQSRYLEKEMEAKRLLGQLSASNQANQQHAKVNQAHEEDILRRN
jgi:acyl-CoA-binding protein